MWNYSCYDPFKRKYLVFESRAMPRMYTIPAYRNRPVVPIQATIVPLPNDAVFVKTSDIPIGVFCSLEQIEKARQIKTASESDTSVLDLVYIGTSVFTLLGLMSAVSK